jgi:hypothetical protein
MFWLSSCRRSIGDLVLTALSSSGITLRWICGMGIPAHVRSVTGLRPVFMGKDAHATEPL